MICLSGVGFVLVVVIIWSLVKMFYHLFYILKETFQTVFEKLTKHCLITKTNQGSNLTYIGIRSFNKSLDSIIIV